MDLGHRCGTCGGQTVVRSGPPRGRQRPTFVTVEHRAECPAAPGGPMWNRAVARLRMLTSRQALR